MFFHSELLLVPWPITVPVELEQTIIYWPSGEA